MKLRSIKFIKKKDNPLKFIESFKSCFSENVSKETKALRLLNYIEENDKSKFDEVWLSVDNKFDLFVKLFLCNYLESYVLYRNLKLSTFHTTYSSFKQYFLDKFQIYKEFEELDDQKALEKVFFELPINIY